MSDGFVRCSFPDEAQVAVSGSYGVGCARVWYRTGAVDVQLPLIGKPVRVAAVIELHNLGPEHRAVERVRPLPVGDGDDNVVETGYSHSIVAGGFDVTSSTTRFTPGISLTIRPEIVSIRSYGRRAQSAVIASSLVTARMTIG